MRELREFAIVASCFVIVIGSASAMSSGCGSSDTGQGGAGGTGGTPSSLPSTGGNTNNGGSTPASTNGSGGTILAGSGGSTPAGSGGSNGGGSNAGGSSAGGANAGGGGASSSSASSVSASSAVSVSASSVAASSVSASSSVSVSASSVAASSSSTGGGNSLTVWINELHYNNVSTDSGEGVEIAGVAGTDLTGFTVALYNGGDGTVYGTITLSGSIPSQSNGFGTLSFPKAAIQNGPDGLALVDSGGHVLQFLSYQGVFAATGGPAMGTTSTNIGVAESDSTPAGDSLQLTGAGHTYSDFTWAAPAQNTFGAVNTGQTFP